MKKILCFIMSVIITVTPITIRAKEEKERNIRVFVDNSQIKCNISPIVHHGKLLVPMRPVLNSLKAKSEWDKDTNEITITSKDNRIIKMKIDSEEIKQNDKIIKIDVAPTIIFNTTMIPISDITQWPGVSLEWCEDINIVAIYTNPDKIIYETLYNLKGEKQQINSRFKEEYIQNGWNDNLDKIQQTALYNSEGEIKYTYIGCVNDEIEKGWYTDPVCNVYLPGGETKIIKKSETEEYKNKGWYTEPVCNVYAPDGRVLVISKTETEDYKKVGWHTEPLCTMYAPDGRTLVIRKAETEDYKKVGWYTEPVCNVYALDGRTLVISKSETESYKKVGWYAEPSITMYTPDGRVLVISKSEMEAYKSVGWYTEPVCMIYAPDGRTLVINRSEIDAYKKVGWYTNAKSAIAGAYPKHGVRVLRTNTDINSVGGVEPTIIWRNDSGKTIKYIYFTCVPYNAVGDIVSCTITGRAYERLQLTGPFAPFSGDDMRANLWYYGKGASSRINENHKVPGTFYVSRGSYRDYLTVEDCNFVFNFTDSWNPIWYNSSARYIKITNIDVIYMDGTTEKISNPPMWEEVFKNAGI